MPPRGRSGGCDASRGRATRRADTLHPQGGPGTEDDPAAASTAPPDSIDRPVSPWPIEQPSAVMPPKPISVPPTRWLASSAGEANDSSLKSRRSQCRQRDCRAARRRQRTTPKVARLFLSVQKLSRSSAVGQRGGEAQRLRTVASRCRARPPRASPGARRRSRCGRSGTRRPAPAGRSRLRRSSAAAFRLRAGAPDPGRHRGNQQRDEQPAQCAGVDADPARRRCCPGPADGRAGSTALSRPCDPRPRRTGRAASSGPRCRPPAA